MSTVSRVSLFQSSLHHIFKEFGLTVWAEQPPLPLFFLLLGFFLDFYARQLLIKHIKCRLSLPKKNRNVKSTHSLLRCRQIHLAIIDKRRIVHHSLPLATAELWTWWLKVLPGVQTSTCFRVSSTPATTRPASVISICFWHLPLLEGSDSWLWKWWLPVKRYTQD